MNAVLYGECVDGRVKASVRISRLDNRGCQVETDNADQLLSGSLALWIGALGPFTATAAREDERRLALRFIEPLDGRILEHFAH